MLLWRNLLCLNAIKGSKIDVKDDGISAFLKNHWTYKNVKKSDKWLSIRVVAEELNLDRETVRKILTEYLEMRKIFVKMVPRILTDNWFIHHELHWTLSPAHDALTMRSFLHEKQISKLDHPSYSPNLAPWDFAFSKYSKRSNEFINVLNSDSFV